MMNRDRLFLLDGNNYAYRAFHAIGELSNSHGFPTNAIYGFAKMLFKMLRDHQPTHIAVIFDSKGPTFRHAIYDQYKATRKPTPEKLLPQLQVIKEFSGKMGITVIEIPGVEADDIIGSLAQSCANNTREVVIISGDKDFMQLIGDNVSLWDTMKDVRYDAQKVKDFLGVEPRFVVDFIALAGDASDNIPGVPGIGKKGAASLIERFGNIAAIMTNCEKIPNVRVKESLRQNTDSLQLSYQLAQIRTDIKIGYDIDALSMRPIDQEGIFSLLKLYEFGSLLQELKREQSDTAVAYLTIDAKSAADKASVAIRQGGKLALIPAQMPMQENITGIAVSSPLSGNYFFPLGFLLSEEGKEVAKLFADATVGKIVHDGKALTKKFQNHKLPLEGVFFDTQIGAYLLNPSLRGYSVVAVAMERLGIVLAEEYNEQAAIKNSVLQASVLLKLADNIEQKLRVDGLFELFASVEMPLIEVLSEMENRVVLVDKKLVEEMSEEFQHIL
ncbi:MAG: hypothetical protein K9K75_06665, partial [Deltaproteobacteria bacterium]|nr:hypothetical protein [Deltaproteobacteria bacterium]